VPTIYAAPRGEGSQIVEQHGAGMVVQPMDPAALASACLCLSRDPQLRSRMAAAAALAAPLYSRTRQAKDSLAVLQRACNLQLRS
jgi:sucrose-phosphate synthase